MEERLTPQARSLALFCALCLLAGCGDTGPVQEGIASYYADSLHGRPTASGEPYNKDALTAAHKHLPLGTRVRVTRLDNGKSVEVTINDRGPFVEDRIIDLSHAAAERIDLIGAGTAKVRVRVLD